jgi:hypothetical protein
MGKAALHVQSSFFLPLHHFYTEFSNMLLLHSIPSLLLLLQCQP